MKIILAIINFLMLSTLVLTVSGCNGGNGGVRSSWVQLGPGGQVIARVINSGGSCPVITVDGQGFQMSLRQLPDDEFPSLVCEFLIPEGASGASVDGRALSLPVSQPERLVIIGDTGCRLEFGDPPQSCNDPGQWPFERIALAASSFAPDLVIHVGDYLYREDDACPEGDEGCEGSPFGDNETTWKADFFSPADPLLRAAPWAFTRGNHEECSRAGRGWFNFLDPNPPFADCQKYTPPYAINLDGLQLLMLDSSAAKDDSAPAEEVAVYTAQIDELEDAALGDGWIVTHHPFWGIGQDSDGVFDLNDTLQTASGNVLTDDISLVLSGHIHLFELLKFDSGRQPQFVIGFSATELDPEITVPLAGMEIGGDTVSEGITFDQFGFVTMERAGNLWNAQIRDVDGLVLLECVIDGSDVDCSQ